MPATTGQIQHAIVWPAALVTTAIVFGSIALSNMNTAETIVCATKLGRRHEHDNNVSNE